MDPNINRRKTAMVLHDLEASLGEYVISTESKTEDFPNELLQDIVKREQERDRALDISKPRDVIEATYLDELFQIIIEITKDTSANEYLLRLKQLFVIYGIYEIRNVVSHPNRKFIDSYWYKVASISSDPIIDVLGMDKVKMSLISAEKGEITDPPLEWVKKVIWEVPNNLPESFEHAITGLVGRQNEVTSLINLLKNKRVNNIAVVAPGGIGKTSLALDLLETLVKLPETKDYFSSCLFVSLKTEKLTSEGIHRLDSIETISELKTLITKEAEILQGEDFTSYEEMCEKLSSERILLFIDNLETLLIDSEVDFQDFSYSLPPLWRLMVTSRISINNSSIISLDPLRIKSATHLARTYLSRRGGKVLNENILSDLAKKCHCNPLSIRLTLDLYTAGKEIPASINVANKEIASFSYRNLIDSLSEEAVKILEALFVSDGSDRITLCEILTISREDLAEGISELSNTSLITRKVSEDGEIYNLSDSIRDLLLVNPRNIQYRENIQSEINKRKVLTNQIEADQVSHSVPIYHWDYIPKELNENLKLLLTELNKSIRKFSIKAEKAISLNKRFKDYDHLYEGIAIFNRGYARVLEALNANDLAISRYKKAIEIDENDPNSKIFLAMLYHKCSNYDLSHSLYKELVDLGWDKEKDGDTKIAHLVVTGFYISMLFDHKYDEILDLSKNWKKLGHFRGVVGSFRAAAWKRKAENHVSNEIEIAIKYLTSAIRILDDIFRNDGYIKSACTQTKNIFNELAYCLNHRGYLENSEFSNEALSFINNHLVNTIQHINFSEDDFIYSLVSKLSKLKIANNPFNSQHWKNYCSSNTYEGIDKNEVKEKCLLEVVVTNLPKPKSNEYSSFIFAETRNGDSYFLHFDQLKNGNWRNWCQIRVRDILAIKPSLANKKPGKATPVIEIFLTEEY